MGSRSNESIRHREKDDAAFRRNPLTTSYYIVKLFFFVCFFDLFICLIVYLFFELLLPFYWWNKDLYFMLFNTSYLLNPASVTFPEKEPVPHDFAQYGRSRYRWQREGTRTTATSRSTGLQAFAEGLPRTSAVDDRLIPATAPPPTSIKRSVTKTNENAVALVKMTRRATSAHPYRWRNLLDYLLTRSTPPSRPNTVGLKCPSARPSIRPSVRPSTKRFLDFHEIWYVGRGRRVMHEGMQYNLLQRQGQGHEPLKVGNSTIFDGYLLPHSQWGLANDHGFIN